MRALRGKSAYKYDDSDFARAWAVIRSLVDRRWIDKRISDAVTTVLRVADRYGQPGYAWSGGKDSVALQVVMDRCGVIDGVMCACPLDLPEHLDWCDSARPDGVTIRMRDDLDDEWLMGDGRKYLFCNARTEKDALLGQRFQIMHHRDPIREAYAEMRLGVIFTGRRKQDKNAAASPDKPTRDGARYCNPIYDWTHEETMAAIVYNGLRISPSYGNVPLCWYDGPRSWNARKVDSHEAGWRETYDLDTNIVRRMAAGFDGARRELISRGVQ